MDAFWMEAFDRLSTMRPGGMGLYPIAYDKALWYFERQGLAPDVVRAGADIVMAMDGEFMAWHREQMELARMQGR